jgi:LPS O-antigen subunit length determinant protein (WzzB/FepE family)
MATTVEQIAKLKADFEKKVQQLQAAEELALNRQIKKLSKGGRASDTRMKILLGSYFFEKMEKNPDYKARALAGLQGYLKRDDDRALFGFEPLPKDKKTKTAEVAPATKAS